MKTLRWSWNLMEKYSRYWRNYMAVVLFRIDSGRISLPIFSGFLDGIESGWFVFPVGGGFRAVCFGFCTFPLLGLEGGGASFLEVRLGPLCVPFTESDLNFGPYLNDGFLSSSDQPPSINHWAALICATSSARVEGKSEVVVISFACGDNG